MKERQLMSLELRIGIKEIEHLICLYVVLLQTLN